MSDHLLERAVAADRDAIIHYLREVDREFYRPLSSRVEDLEAYVEKLLNRAQVVLVQRGDSIVGLAAVYTNDSGRREAYLAQLTVCERARGKGLGRALMRWVEQQAEADGMKTIRLEVDNANAAAISLYRRFRFRREGPASPTSFFMRRLLS